MTAVCNSPTTDEAQKKDAPALDQQDTSNSGVDTKTAPYINGNTGDTDSIALIEDVVNTSSGKRWRGRESKPLGAKSKVYAVAIKCYDEQVPGGTADLVARIKGCDKKVAQVLAIRHDRDEVTDGIWAVSAVKAHWHIIFRFIQKDRRMRVSDILAGLGVVFRKGTDDKLWLNHGIESIGNFSGYAMYLTHETEQAIRDGKELYGTSEIVSNLDDYEVAQIRDGYIRVSENRKLSTEELIALDKEAYDLGYKLGDFDAWYSAQTFAVRSHAKMRTIRESYDRGVATRIDAGDEILRLCIFIRGAKNTGKTYTAKAALREMGKHLLAIEGGGTGKYDKLRPSHDAIVISDDTAPNLLNMTDNYICHAYKRNSNNPAWAGEYFIATYNDSFDDWLAACGFRVEHMYRAERTQQAEAMRSRFYLCEIATDPVTGISHLACIEPSRRGSPAEQAERLARFVEFKTHFDRLIAQYNPTVNNTVDYSGIIERRRVQ